MKKITKDDIDREIDNQTDLFFRKVQPIEQDLIGMCDIVCLYEDDISDAWDAFLRVIEERIANNLFKGEHLP